MTDTTRPCRPLHVYPCERVPGDHRGRWIIQSYHQTGMPYADELCPHYQTREAAREAAREDARDDARERD